MMWLPKRSFAGLGLLTCAVAIASACGSRSAPPDASVPSRPASAPAPEPAAPPAPVPPAPDDAGATVIEGEDGACLAIPPTGEPIRTVGLADRVDPAHAPSPANASEQLLFRQVYETLVRVDCGRRARAGLASSWVREADGRWTITLRDGARFADATPVTAHEVVAGWMGDGGAALRPPVGAHLHAAVARDDRTLTITVRAPADAPVVLAHPDLAVVKRPAASLWPLGTRGVRIESGGDLALPGGRAIVTVTGASGSSPAADAGAVPWSIRFVVDAGSDARDLLDAGVDLLVTNDPAALDYAATLPELTTLPMPWRSTYVFVSAARTITFSSPSPEARAALASAAIRQDARGAEEPFWWEMASDCDLSASQAPARPPSASGRIVYAQGDGPARDLAGRLVGLARAAGANSTRDAAVLADLLPGAVTRFQRATGLSGEALVVALRGGSDAGYIIPLERVSFDPCRDVQRLIERIPWLDPAAMAPLADTRPKAVVRDGRGGVILEGDGALLISRPAAVR